MIKISLALLLTVFSLSSFAATQTAVFAGGCFWSMQHDLDKVKGVVKSTVGYTGGKVANPSYSQVSRGDTGHLEAIEVVFDPSLISYPQLVQVYLHDTDPSDSQGQFCDKGSEYHAAIFVQDADQRAAAKSALNDLKASQHFDAIYTQILPLGTFYPAEDYHQKYSDKNPEAYANYRQGCQRDSTLAKVWQ